VTTTEKPFIRKEITAPDINAKGFVVELTKGDRWGCVQVATVNTNSELRIAADDGDGTVQFTGWRFSLDLPALDQLIEAATELREELKKEI